MPYRTGMYQGVDYVYHAVPTGVSDLDNYFNDIVKRGKDDAIVSLVMIPRDFQTNSETPIYNDFRPTGRPNSIHGYTPRNKKLLTFPYVGLCVDCLNDVKNYQYELFKDPKNIRFTLATSVSPNPEIVCYPYEYNGSGNGINPTETVTMTGLPQCAFTIDAYRAWLAHKAVPQGINLTASAANTGLGIAQMVMSGGITGVGSTINNAANTAATAWQMWRDSTLGSKVRGTQGSGTDVATRQMNFYFKHMAIRVDYAKAIDSYFDRFGYTTMRIKIPNRNVRPHWTYTRTYECTIKGNLPVNAMKNICNIYNRGITFWRHGDEVGNYSLVNSPEQG